jgi:HAD superfamily hydrolase (TIGR01509 family)
MPGMALDGMVFDVDGTLVDSNGVHVEAWRRAFERHEYKIPPDRIFYEIGKGGDQLVPHLIGKDGDKKDGKALRKAQPEEFGKLVEAQGLRPFPGSRELIETCRKRGLRTVIATSSEEKQLKLIEKSSGVPWRELVDETVMASDVERSKPAPDVVAAAVKKLRMTPAQCAMVGDTPYDAESAKHAGVVCLGVTCGGHPVETLVHSGARAAWRDPADLLDHLDNVLRIASPGSAHLTQDLLERLMRDALSCARDATDAGEAPIGCVLARGDGAVIARGFNELNRTQNKTAHAEMVTFARAAGKVPTDARDLILVSTLEPCVMCTGAAMQAAVDTIVYGLKAPADSGTARVSPPQSPESQMPRIVGDVLPDESRKLFEQWLAKPGNNPRQVAFVRQLLALT